MTNSAIRAAYSQMMKHICKLVVKIQYFKSCYSLTFHKRQYEHQVYLEVLGKALQILHLKSIFKKENEFAKRKGWGMREDDWHLLKVYYKPVIVMNFLYIFLELQKLLQLHD